MGKFKVVDALGREQIVEASSMAAVTSKIERTGKRNVFGVERLDRAGNPQFFLDRAGQSGLWPISAKAAGVELAMGGFE